MIERIDQSNDKKISITLMAPFVILTIQYFILIYFNLLGTTYGNRVQLMSKAIVGVVFLYVLPVVIRRSKENFITVYSIAATLFLIHYLIFPKNHIYIKELIFPFFFMCLPAFVYSMSLSDWQVLKQIMKKSSLIIFFFGTILGIFNYFGWASVGTYSMSLSYYMLIPTLIFLDELLDAFSLRNLIFSFISIMTVLTLGSRGAIMCILVFTILKVSRFYFKLTYTKILYYMISLGIAVFIFIYLDHILKSLYNFLLNYGIRSRSILLFMRGEIHLSGRESIYQSIMRNILDNPILGIGLGGDRLVIGGGYAHNFFIEVLGDFGIFVGGIIIVTLSLLIIKSLLTKNKDKYNMIIIWLSLGFVHLMVSGSYLIDIKFWIFMGILTSIFSNRICERSPGS